PAPPVSPTPPVPTDPVTVVTVPPAPPQDGPSGGLAQTGGEFDASLAVAGLLALLSGGAVLALLRRRAER
ncbi:MAG: LPXTG cell wall anchor domain-containing protein, partial [Pseudoclavibacter sp.]|nr:LPXTG cell wall anchor domain-containing protein [Pseudoclavibacter sp.]